MSSENSHAHTRHFRSNPMPSAGLNTELLGSKTRVLQEQLERRVLKTQLLSSKLTLTQYFNIMCSFYQSYSQLEKLILNYEKQARINSRLRYQTRLPAIEAEISELGNMLKLSLPIPSAKTLLTGNGNVKEVYWGIRYAVDSFSTLAAIILPKLELTVGMQLGVNLNFWKILKLVEQSWPNIETAINGISIDNPEQANIVECAQETFILMCENLAGIKTG